MSFFFLYYVFLFFIIIICVLLRCTAESVDTTTITTTTTNINNNRQKKQVTIITTTAQKRIHRILTKFGHIPPPENIFFLLSIFKKTYCRGITRTRSERVPGGYRGSEEVMEGHNG